MMETGRSWTSGCGSAPLGVVIRVTCRSRAHLGSSRSRGGSLHRKTPYRRRLEFTTCLGPVAAAVAVVTWLAKVAMGVAREPVTVPRLDMPAEIQTS